MTSPLISDLKGIPIRWADSPFASLGNGTIYSDVRPSGMTIAEVVASIPGLPASFVVRGAVCINGEPVPRAMWARVRPRTASDSTPITVTLHLPLGDPGGGGSAGGRNKNPLILIASIALIAATIWIGAGGLAFLGAAFQAGHIGATMLAAGLNLAGSLLVAALTPPPTLSPTSSNDQSLGSASGDANVIQLGGSLPRVCGTFRVFPSPVADPLIEIIGENEYVTQVFALAGPHAISNVLVAGADIQAGDDITLETREGWPNDPPLTLITRQAKVALPQAQLRGHIFDPGVDLDWSSSYTGGSEHILRDQSNPDSDLPPWVPFASRASPDEIWLHLYWPSGLGVPNAPDDSVGCPIRVRIRRRGDSTWINLPEIHFVDHRLALIRKTIKIMWGTAPAMPTPPAQYGPLYAFRVTPQQTMAPTATAPQGWSSHANFSKASGDDYLSSANLATTRLQNIALYADRAEFYLDAATFPQGVYDIQVKRGAIYGNNLGSGSTTFVPSTYTYNNAGFTYPGIFDFFFYQTDGGHSLYRAPFLTAGTPDSVMVARVLSIWNQNPIPTGGNALLCLQATNRGLNQVSVLAKGYVRDWNAALSAWSDWVTTSNPAAHFRDVLAGDLTSRTAPMVNDQQIVDWRQRCSDKGYTFDAIVDGRSMAEVLSLLAGAGYARPRKSERWGVIVDKDRSAETPSQIFNPRNLANFRFEKAFADLPDGFIVNFRNADLDYIPDQVVVYRKGFGAANASRLESIDYIGPVTTAAASARAAFDLAQAELRSTFYYADADIESIVTETGDLAAVQHDILDHYAGFAYVKDVHTSGGNVTGFKLDSSIPLTTPDDPLGIGDFFSLNNLFTGILGVNFFELADVFVTADVFADGTAPIGIAVRQFDGTILTKAVIAASVDSDDVTVAVPFADPGRAVLDAGCLVHSGALGREYRRLILREVVPGKDLTGALVFIDEANELWKAAA